MASIGSSHKRKRKPKHDTKIHYKHKTHSGGSKSKHQAAKSITSSTKSQSSTTPLSTNARPTWVPTKDTYPWNTSSAIYGNCINVSSRYEKIGRIGEGTYGKFIICNAHHVHNFTLFIILTTYTGVVYQAKDKQTNEIVALKRCLPHHEASDGFPLTTLREITILRELQCAGGEKHGIIGLKDVTTSSRYVYIVLYCGLFI